MDQLLALVNSNDPTDFRIAKEFLDQLYNYQLLKADPAPL
jgi:hypothetical protein